MSEKKPKDPFWTSFSDLMTSLFFVMLVLFIICIIKVGKSNHDLSVLVDSIRSEKDSLAISNERLNNILKLEDQFKVLSSSSSLDYDSEKKMFYAKDLVGIEIFVSNDDKIKPEYYETVDKIGKDLDRILKNLTSEKDFSYQLVIEGNAAIPWKELHAHTYNADNREMYLLSYRRALALYDRWKKVDKIDLRKYNTEIIIAGSGFNGNNRDMKKEDNNKRFIIQIIPKINRPVEK